MLVRTDLLLSPMVPVLVILLGYSSKSSRILGQNLLHQGKVEGSLMTRSRFVNKVKIRFCG